MLSGRLGSDFGSRDLVSDKNIYDFGISHYTNDNAEVDLRAYGGNLDDETVVLTFSFFN